MEPPSSVRVIFNSEFLSKVCAVVLGVTHQGNSVGWKCWLVQLLEKRKEQEKNGITCPNMTISVVVGGDDG
jgi:hypothetical protein